MTLHVEKEIEGLMSTKCFFVNQVIINFLLPRYMALSGDRAHSTLAVLSISMLILSLTDRAVSVAQAHFEVHFLQFLSINHLR